MSTRARRVPVAGAGQTWVVWPADDEQAGTIQHLRAEREVDGFPGWKVSARFRADGDQLLLEALTVEPSGVNAPPGEQVTVAMLRAIRLRDLYREVWQALKNWASRASTDAASNLQGRPGRAGRSDRPYAELAARYLELCLESDRPVVDLAAERFQGASTVRNLLHEAGRRQLLERTQGRAGGRLTEKAKQLLEEGDR